jgi:hypothetical protein
MSVPDGVAALRKRGVPGGLAQTLAALEAALGRPGVVTVDEDGNVDADFTEIVDADIARVDLVGAGANGYGILIAKSREEVMASTTARRVPVRKAPKSKQVAVYDEQGRLVGLVDPDDSGPVIQGKPAGGDEGKAAPGTTPFPRTDFASPPELTPAASDTVGTPTAGTAPTTEAGVVKAAVATVAKAKAQGMTDAGLALLRLQTAQHAAQEIRRLRARRR